MITVTVSEAVEVEGDPEFEFSLTNPGSAANNPQATYDRTRSIATTIVFTYTVQAGDMDNNGIWIGTHSQTFMLDANDRIRTASQQIDIDRSHPEKGTQGGHKVDGSLGAPTLVSATATTLTIEWTHPGDGGSPLTRNFVHYRVEGTTDWTNWYAGETPVTRAVITNLQAETAYDVRVHATNAIGNSSWVQSASAFSTLAGDAANHAATGAPTITGTAAVGQVLAVDLTGIADADGLTNVSYSYQWVRVDADGMSNPADIADATDATYTLVDADLGKTLKVRVTFDDAAGNTETLTSAATVTVTTAAGAPASPTGLVRNGRGRAGRAGVAAPADGDDGGNSWPLRIPLFGGGNDCAGRDVATSPVQPRYGKSGIFSGGEGSDERHDPYPPGSCGKRARRKRAGDGDRDTTITAVLHHRRVRRPAPALAGPTDSRDTRNLHRWKYRDREWGWRDRSWNPDT